VKFSERSDSSAQCWRNVEIGGMQPRFAAVAATRFSNFFLWRDAVRSAAYAVMLRLSVSLAVTFVHCVETAEDTASCWGVRIGNRAKAFEWYHFQTFLTQNSKSRHYLTLNVSETVRDRHYTRPIQGYHFEWPWETLSDLAKCSMTRSIARLLFDSCASC